MAAKYWVGNRIPCCSLHRRRFGRASSIEALCDRKSRVSAHVVVGRDGAITQLVTFDMMAWHAWLSSFGGRDGSNRYAIGIEIDNPGRPVRSEDGKFRAWFGRVARPGDTAMLVHRNEQASTPWHLYAEPQIAAVFELAAVLCTAYPMRGAGWPRADSRHDGRRGRSAARLVQGA